MTRTSPGAMHPMIYAELDPVRVAGIVNGYGIDAACERWWQWSPRAIRRAAQRGRRKSFEIEAARNPETDSVEAMPAA
jgi:hypothetical protein